MTLLEAAPPAGLNVLRAWPVGSIDDVANIRAELRKALDELPPQARPPTSPDRIVLVASELATNAVRHGSQPVTLRLLVDGGATTVDVVDHRPDAPPVLATDRPGAGGFGLQLAHRAAHTVGWCRAGDEAKHVWAHFS